MNINSLIELDDTINNRIEFLLLNIQDMLVETLHLDEDDFAIQEGGLVYKNTIKIYPNIGKHTAQLICKGTIIDESITYASISDKFKGVINGSI